MTTVVLAGTWEEILKHALEFVGHRLRVKVLSEEKKPQPNRGDDGNMEKVKEKQKDMRFTNGSKTQQILRAARGGAMFGGEIDE